MSSLSQCDYHIRQCWKLSAHPINTKAISQNISWTTEASQLISHSGLENQAQKAQRKLIPRTKNCERICNTQTYNVTLALYVASAARSNSSRLAWRTLKSLQECAAILLLSLHAVDMPPDKETLLGSASSLRGQHQSAQQLRIPS